MRFHKVSGLFPPMTSDEYEEIKTDIEVNGLNEPIVTYENKIVDGRHRYRACLELGIKPKFREWHGRGSLLQFILSMNLHRRHLSTSQRALLGAELRSLFTAEARRRQGTRTDLSADLRGRSLGKSSEEAARLVNVSARSVEIAAAVKREGASELLDAVKSGLVSISMAAAIAKLPIGEQQKLLSLGSRTKMRHALYRRQRPALMQSPRQAARSALIVRQVIKALEDLYTIIGDREPQAMAKIFMQDFPVHDAQMLRRLETSIRSARLFAEIDAVLALSNSKSEKQ